MGSWGLGCCNGQPARDPLSIRGAWWPGSAAPAPSLFKQALACCCMETGEQAAALAQSDVAALFSPVCSSLKSCHQSDFRLALFLSLSLLCQLITPKGQACISRACLPRAEERGPTDRRTERAGLGGTGRRTSTPPTDTPRLLPLEWLLRVRGQCRFCLFVLRALLGREWSALTHASIDIYLAPTMLQALLPPFPTGDCVSDRSRRGCAEP